MLFNHSDQILSHLSRNVSSSLCFLFPGSGSQYVGMGKSISKQYPAAAHIFSKANDILGYDITNICFNGKVLELNKIKNSLLAIYITTIAYLEVFKQHVSLTPKYLLGHSLGEYSALTFSGAISFEDGLKIVEYRAQISQEACLSPAMMTIVKNVDYQHIEKMCQEYQEKGTVSIGCYNSENQVLLTGHEEALQGLEQTILKSYPLSQIIPLISSPPFHSSLLKDAAQNLNDQLKKCSWGSFHTPVISNVNAKPYFSKIEAISLLTEQLYKPVRWIDCLNYLKSQNITTVIEIGPQTILKQLNSDKNLSFLSFDDPKDRMNILSQNIPLTIGMA